jgi:ATP-dependent DNA helicase RecQ
MGYRLEEVEPEFAELLWASLFIVDPSVGPEALDLPSWGERCESELERRFVRTLIERRENGVWAQLLEPQRALDSIVAGSRFVDQRVDFALELPALDGASPGGLIFEVDGPRHTRIEQRVHDDARDEALRSEGWSVSRLTAHALRTPSSEPWSSLTAQLDRPEIAIFEANHRAPLRSRPGGLRALNLALAPLGVARLHRVLLELIRDGTLRIHGGLWRIGVIERDVECAKIALDDLFLQLDRLFILARAKWEKPSLELTVFAPPPDNPSDTSFVTAVGTFAGEVLIDLGVLGRWGLTPALKTRARRTLTIRSSHSRREPRRLGSAVPIRYLPEIDKSPIVTAEEREAIDGLVRDIFRKRGLREGQLEIIARALRREDVIGLLPTGAGKSLTYQICALLQPGVTLVVDPIKALMKDQDVGLRRNFIDATTFVNSSLTTTEKNKAYERFEIGELLFCFASPERFAVSEFRQRLDAMHRGGVTAFTHVVIDEAHCVSEWGHDFRTAYLRLGEQARRFCRTWRGLSQVPLLGLTATASFDVLADVRRELGVDADGVISKLGEGRPELTFEVIEVKVPGEGEPTQGHAERLARGRAKAIALGRALASLPTDLEDEARRRGDEGFGDPSAFFEPDAQGRYAHGVLVFCPHKGGAFGVAEVASYLENENHETRTFHGGQGRSDAHDAERNQEDFTSNAASVMVATKAFGMGVDKPNVRATIHFVMPASIESFVQEAGRGGRDRRLAKCMLLHHRADTHVLDYFHDCNFPGMEKDIARINCLLRGYDILSRSPLREIEDHIQAETGAEVRLNDWSEYGHSRIYADTTDGACGYVDLRNLRADHRKRSASVDPRFALSILSCLCKKLAEIQKSGIELQNWIRSASGMARVPGLLDLLAEHAEGEEFTWVVPHELKDTSDGKEASTAKALYRLAVIGVIDDQLEDYNAETSILTVRKKPDAAYVGALSAYLGRYLSPLSVKKEIDAALVDDGRPLLERLLGVLIAFTYSFIGARRKRALTEMKDLAERAIQSGDSRAIARDIALYFSSKFHGEMARMTQDGVNFDIDIVRHFLDQTKGITDELEHLFGSTARLLADNPHNGGLLVLRATAAILLEREAVRSTPGPLSHRGAQADLDLAEGLVLFDEAGQDPLEVLRCVRAQLIAHNPPTLARLEGLEPQFALRRHTRWLKDFNDRYHH